MNKGISTLQVEGDYYCNFKYQPMDFAIDIHADMPTGCIIKYITRYPFKDGIKDLEKAKQIIDKIEKKSHVVMLANDWHEKTCKYCALNNLSKNQIDALFTLFAGYYNSAKESIDRLIREYKKEREIR